MADRNIVAALASIGPGTGKFFGVGTCLSLCGFRKTANSKAITGTVGHVNTPATITNSSPRNDLVRAQ